MRWISYINLFAIAIVLLLVGQICILTSQEEPPPELLPPKKYTAKLPENPFAQGDAKEVIESGPLALHFSPPKVELPDLKEIVVFFGKSKRPDINDGAAPLYLGIRGSNEELASISEGKRVYLVYQRKNKGNEKNGNDQQIWGENSSAEAVYVFSPDNQPTPLWLEAKLSSDGKSIHVKVNLLDELGMPVSSPENLAHFTLNTTPWQAATLPQWDIGGIRVDSSLLVRQKAKWVGQDHFLELHGGSDYAECKGKERLDFINTEGSSSCFVKEGGYLIWKDDRWTNPSLEEDTKKYNLLVVKKIDEKVMQFELWDTVGRRNVMMNLLKTKDAAGFPNIEQEFSFVGAKTWAQFITECRGQRQVLRPNDWLIFTDNGWHVISSEEEIDSYVSQRLQGPLFIVDKMSKENGRQVLVGHVFNSTRTEMRDVELPQVSNSLLAKPVQARPILSTQQLNFEEEP